MDLEREGRRRSDESSAHWPTWRGPNRLERLGSPPGQAPWYCSIESSVVADGGARGLAAVRLVAVSPEQPAGTTQSLNSLNLSLNFAGASHNQTLREGRAEIGLLIEKRADMGQNSCFF